MILKFRVYEQTISLQSTKSEPRQGSKDYLELQFSFSSDWNGFSKYVYLQHGEVSVPHDLVEESIIVDEYFTEQTEFNVTLFGRSADGSVEVPTNVITVFLKESNNLWVKDAPEPQNSWLVQVVDARDEALAAAIRAENAAIHQPYPNSETGTWWVWSAETVQYEDTGISYGGSGGTSDHTKLSNRNAADQHPMSAITGLEKALDGKQPVGSYITEESDPTVPEWAKQQQKPAYTAQEVGALPATTAIPSTAADVNAEPAGSVSQHNVSDAAHSDIRLLIQGLSDRLSAVADSDDTTLDQLSEVVAYIKSNRTLIEAITTNKVSVSDIIDNLTTNASNKPLSAAQGVALKALIDAITVPDKLPNPHALIFTGAVTGSYDGSAPLEVAIPSGGADCTIAVDMLASGTVVQGSEEPVDTGVTFGKLKEYKMFILSVSGVSNVSLHNWYTKIGDLSISRVNNVRGQTILYEFLNTEKTVMIARNGTNGNHSVYESYKASSTTYGVNNASYFPDGIYELSSISESTHVITYPIKSDAVDVKWTILGVVK